MTTFRPVLKSAGVDYITATTGERKANEWIQNFGQQLLNQERLAGNDICSFWLQNFSGLTCGSVQLAKSNERVMIRLSSQLAALHWQEVAEVASNISRLDIQSTVQFGQNERSLASKLEKRALKYCREHDSRLRVELRRNNKTGQTLYCGSRFSDRFVRIYDKGMESKLPELRDHWRGEIELHRSRAKLTAHQMLQSKAPNVWASQAVSQHLKKLGIAWPSALHVSQTVAQLPKPERNQSRDGRRLQWLRYQVRPTVARLSHSYSRVELLDVLGLLEDTDEV